MTKWLVEEETSGTRHANREKKKVRPMKCCALKKNSQPNEVGNELLHQLNQRRYE